jgi:ElaB/YqjD/DUF883 family membrane-anchored ribosome-binding protein
MAQSTQYGGTTTSSELKEKVADQLEKVAGRVETAAASAVQQAQDLADRASEVGEQVSTVASNVKGAVDTSLKQQPMTTLAVAAVLGFVLGALWKS